MKRQKVQSARGETALEKLSVIRRVACSLPLILAVALILRIGFAFDYIRQNPRQGLAVIPFLQEAGNIAASLATGHGFSSPFRVDTGPTAWMTPVYPALLSGIFRVFGVRTFDSFLAAVGLNILVSTLACWPLFYVGKRIAGLGVGAGAAWLWAMFPNAILNTFQSMWEASLAALLVATILWWTLKLEDSRRWHDWCAYGLLWGVTLMTTATVGILLPLLLAWLGYRSWRSGRLVVGRPALALGVALLCCVPWTVRNYAAFQEFVPLRSVFGLQLWLGNNDHSQEVWLGELHPIFDSAERAEYIQMGEIAYMQEKRREAFDYMRQHPARSAHLMASRFVAIWSGGTPTPSSDFRHTRSLWFRYVLLFNVLAGIGGVAGIAVLIRRHSAYWFPVAIFPAIFPCAYYLTLAYPRYRLPIDPLVLLLGAIAVQGLLGRHTEDVFVVTRRR